MTCPPSPVGRVISLTVYRSCSCRSRTGPGVCRILRHDRVYVIDVRAEWGVDGTVTLWCVS